MSPAVSIATQISKPDIPAEVTENEGEAVPPRGDPTGGGAEEAVLEINGTAVTSSPGRDTVELENVTILSHSLVNLNLDMTYTYSKSENIVRCPPCNPRH